MPMRIQRGPLEISLELRKKVRIQDMSLGVTYRVMIFKASEHIE